MSIDRFVEKIPDKYKEIIPLYSIGSRIRLEIQQLLNIYKDKQRALTYINDKRFIQYESKIKKFHNLHKGERCFILATGPSLQKTNVKLIKDEILFGVNTLFRGMKDLGLKKVDYYAVQDRNMFDQYYKDLLSLDTTFFLGILAAKKYLSNKEEYEKYQKNEPILLRSLQRIRHSGWKTKNITRGVYGSHLVPVGMCLPIAYYLGFNEVYLLGCDCDYSGKKQHFDGFKVAKEKFPKHQEKYWIEVFREFEIYKEGFEADGRKIYNATPGGKLEIFERKRIEDII
jgi:hypothetical protein